MGLHEFGHERKKGRGHIRKKGRGHNEEAMIRLKVLVSLFYHCHYLLIFVYWTLKVLTLYIATPYLDRKCPQKC